jgi:hypothetical protein
MWFRLGNSRNIAWYLEDTVTALLVCLLVWATAGPTTLSSSVSLRLPRVLLKWTPARKCLSQRWGLRKLNIKHLLLYGGDSPTRADFRAGAGICLLESPGEIPRIPILGFLFCCRLHMASHMPGKHTTTEWHPPQLFSNISSLPVIPSRRFVFKMLLMKIQTHEDDPNTSELPFP